MPTQDIFCKDSTETTTVGTVERMAINFKGNACNRNIRELSAVQLKYGQTGNSGNFQADPCGQDAAMGQIQAATGICNYSSSMLDRRSHSCQLALSGWQQHQVFRRCFGLTTDVKSAVSTSQN